MATLDIIGRCGKFFAAELPGGKLTFLKHARSQAGRPKIGWEHELGVLIKRILLERDRVFSNGKGVVLTDHRHSPTYCSTGPEAYCALNKLCRFGVIRVAPAELDVPANLAADDPYEVWCGICHANQILDANLAHSAIPLILPSFHGGDRAELPEYGGQVNHPLVGPRPEGWFGSLTEPAEPTPNQLQLLRELFEPLPLDPASHARLYAYLLASFHTISLVCPTPLLVVDSWTQAIGKTETNGAIAALIDGTRNTLPCPRRIEECEDLISHLITGARVACLDNLTTLNDRPWNNVFITSLLTDRNTAARAKYDRAATKFKGRLATLTLIFGEACLHGDMVSRAWRVQLWGHEGKELKHRPNLFAEKHREALQAAAYWLVRRVEPWASGKISNTRCDEFEQIGAAAYRDLFGLTEAEVTARMRQAHRDAQMLSRPALDLIRSTPDTAGLVPQTLGSNLRKPPRQLLQNILGGRSLGYCVTEQADGKIELQPTQEDFSI